jgi:hypothetical protein
MPLFDFDGRWYNQHGSHMDIQVDSDGDVVGKYTTAVGAPGDEEEFSLVGFAAEDQLSFAVNFGKYASLTAWAGQASEDSDNNAVIITFWHLTKNIPDPSEPENQWATVLTGSDVFKRTVPKVRPLSLMAPSHPRIV